MTLVIAATGKHSVWMLVDRRLTFSQAKHRDDAIKTLRLNKGKDVALLGYAGLGCTAMGNQPSEWMSRVIRGTNLSLEHSLELIHQAMRREFPRHLRNIGQSSNISHSVIAPAISGGLPRIFTISIALSPCKKYFSSEYVLQCTGRNTNRGPISHRLVVTGSGAHTLMKEKPWQKDLLRLIKAFEQRKVSPKIVANLMARQNARVAATDKYVSKKCCVAWSSRKFTSGYEFFDGHQIDMRNKNARIPMIEGSTDLLALSDMMSPVMIELFKAEKSEQEIISSNIDKRIREAVKVLPSEPDETLK